jgi:ribosomal-protein-alanine N-acetyltransferase
VTAGRSGGEAALVSGDRVFLRRITGDDEAEFTRLVRESAALHHPWMELPGTAEEFHRYLSKFDPPVVNIGLAVCELGSGALAGGVNINNIVHGRFRSAALGYWAFAPAAGRGLMSQALRLVVGYAFGDLDLHRLEANIQPANVASIQLVKRNDFRYEGLSPDYLFIDGAWRDHERWAITREMLG